MKEHPILFSGPMVRAILEGRKTQTRRVIKSPAKNMQASGTTCIEKVDTRDIEHPKYQWRMRSNTGAWWHYSDVDFLNKCPYGKPGDRLWVRETYWQGGRYGPMGHDKFQPIKEDRLYSDSLYRGHPITKGLVLHGYRKVSSIHMPRWASRINLEITGIRVERVQDITKTDIRAEGVEVFYLDQDGNDYDFRFSEKQIGYANFRFLWDSINAKRGYGWVVNPWVWVVEFKRVEG